MSEFFSKIRTLFKTCPPCKFSHNSKGIEFERSNSRKISDSNNSKYWVGISGTSSFGCLLHLFSKNFSINVDFKLVGVKACVVLVDLRSSELNSSDTHFVSI